MQTLSPTISPTISSKKVTESETEYLPAIAQSSVMQTALTGLDASLNDELDRYRHWQENGQTISYLNPFRPRAISTQSIWTSPSLSDALSPLTPVTESSNSDRRTIQMPVMPPLGEANLAPSINLSAAELHKYSGLHNSGLQSELNNDGFNNDGLNAFERLSDRHNPSDASYAQPMNGYASNGLGINEPMMAKVPALDDDETLQSFANDYANQYEENYQEQAHQNVSVPQAPLEKSALRSLLNPVGIISLLLLLCSSAAIGYLLVDPAGVMKLFKPDQKPKSAQTEKVGEDLGSDINLQNQQQAKDSSLSFVPLAGDKTTNLTTDSLKNSKNTKGSNNKSLFASPSTKSSNSSSLFVPSSSTFVPTAPLRTVPSTSLPPLAVAPLPPALAPIERSYNPSPSRNRSYEAPASNSPTRSNNYSEPRNSTPRSSSSTRTSAAPSPTYVAPSAATSAAPSAPRTSVKYAAPLSSAPASIPVASSYRVVVENSYAASAQQVERDAFVRPSDGQVQVGSYRDANAAQQRIEQLRRQGIPARIE
ncbi:hypothetical protein H6F42_06555 [Pseudanabaena sp. FACHB-1998]|uniref:SPOR domain-containing protein n=1 Tax=Pseudanabaena sp. FACHB-1998 TaxID=2692858 RepID=UPI001681BEE0|nr:hypothetical protein [Pseudanabaena sp. FACHB-1998]MBD2176574.1 hypothetical protein [Pseudanabaena sp. FACHB-1998]